VPGPIEVIVIAFPGSRFNGAVLPELARLVADNTINIVDGLFVNVDLDGTKTLVEIDDAELTDELGQLADLFDEIAELLSDEDVEELTADLAPGDSAVVLTIEHTWANAFQQAVIESGGVMTANFRVPAAVVDEVLAALNEA
jgi:Family of unknown function (DUF6325)